MWLIQGIKALTKSLKHVNIRTKNNSRFNKNIPAEFGTYNDNHNKFGFNQLNPNLLWINCVILMNQIRPLITQYKP